MYLGYQNNKIKFYTLEKLDEILYNIDKSEETDDVIRIKEFDLKPMTPDEAILQMDLLDHSFFVFNDAESNNTCVVYRRNDGGYGLIVPKE